MATLMLFDWMMKESSKWVFSSLPPLRPAKLRMSLVVAQILQVRSESRNRSEGPFSTQGLKWSYPNDPQGTETHWGLLKFTYWWVHNT